VLNQVHENQSTYVEEREQLLQAIQNAGIPGVIFFTGDRHHTELSKLERPGTYPLYDLTCSSLTAGVANPGNEANTLCVPGTLLTERNFAIMKITGPAKNRNLKIKVLDTHGKELWQRNIKASELK
jgi:alkaline phosphatase D